MAIRRQSNRGMTVAKKKSRKEGEPLRSPHKNVGARIDLQIHAAMEAYRHAQRHLPDVKQVLETALSEFLQREGFDPANYTGQEEEESET